MMEHSFLPLVKEVFYQKEYTYEQRIDFFNKYHIDQTQNFLIPIIELTKFLCKDRRPPTYSEFCMDDRRIQGSYSHSGAIASNFDHNFKNKTLESTVRVKDHTMVVWTYNFEKKKLLPAVEYNDLDKTITFKKHLNMSVTITRDFYEKVDEWLQDFGFQKWSL